MRNMDWQEVSFLDNLNTAVEYLGYDNVAIAFGLARVDWPDIDTRDEFFRTITRPKAER